MKAYPSSGPVQPFNYIFERNLDLTINLIQGPAYYKLIAYMGGVMVVLWLIGYILEPFLTVNAYEENIIRSVYPTKDVLKRRLKAIVAQLPEKEQSKFKYKDLLEPVDPQVTTNDANDPVVKASCCRCI